MGQKLLIIGDGLETPWGIFPFGTKGKLLNQSGGQAIIVWRLPASMFLDFYNGITGKGEAWVDRGTGEYRIHFEPEEPLLPGRMVEFIYPISMKVYNASLVVVEPTLSVESDPLVSLSRRILRLRVAA